VSSGVSKRPGRRVGESGTRKAITEAARRQFAQRGFDRTSLRSVAQEADVDPTLVSHFFGSKQELFVKVVELPFDPAAVLPGVVAGDRDEIGLRLARFIVGVLESDEGRQRFTGLIRAAASEEAAARLVREIVTHRILGTIAEHLGADDAALRASLAGSQVVGLVMARYVVGVEPLASRPADEVAETIAPVLQHYLTEPL
jgi:AcrR family transcriptional regulator